MAKKEEKKLYTEETLKDSFWQGFEKGKQHVFKPLVDYVNEQFDQVFLRQSRESEKLRMDLISKLSVHCLRKESRSTVKKSKGG